MKVLVITGSPHKDGTTAALADQFIAGVEETGNQIVRFDAAFEKVRSCLACEKCHNGSNKCVFRDGMDKLNPTILSADVIAFVSPIYYYNMSSQIRAVIDRFYAHDSEMHGHKKSYLITAMADSEMNAAMGADESFKSMIRYFDWTLGGILNCRSTRTPEDLKGTRWLDDAYEMGKGVSAS